MSTTLEAPAVAGLAPEHTTSPPIVARVLHVINGEHYAGAERVQDLLAQRLPEWGYQVGFACLKPGQFAAVRRATQAPLANVAMRGRIDLRPVWQLVRLVRQEGYHLLHTHSARGALLGRCASWIAGIPHVHHVHSPTANDTTDRWRNRINTLTERVSLCGVRAVAAVSESLGRYAVEHGIAANKVHVVHNGVPVAGPLPPRETPDGLWTLGTVALFRPRKGLEVLLDALARLHTDGHRVRLRAVGGFETPDYQAEILNRVERLGIGALVDWRGFQKDVLAEFRQMDLFVLPSLFGEGLPMVVLEAMAAGVPVVGTRVEGTPEAVRDGLDGAIAEPGDADDLARAIVRLARSELDWQEVRVCAHRRQAEHFSDMSMAAGVARIYDRVLNHQR